MTGPKWLSLCHEMQSIFHTDIPVIVDFLCTDIFDPEKKCCVWQVCTVMRKTTKRRTFSTQNTSRKKTIFPVSETLLSFSFSPNLQYVVVDMY